MGRLFLHPQSLFSRSNRQPLHVTDNDDTTSLSNDDTAACIQLSLTKFNELKTLASVTSTTIILLAMPHYFPPIHTSASQPLAFAECTTYPNRKKTIFLRTVIFTLGIKELHVLAYFTLGLILAFSGVNIGPSLHVYVPAPMKVSAPTHILMSRSPRVRATFCSHLDWPMNIIIEICFPLSSLHPRLKVPKFQINNPLPLFSFPFPLISSRLLNILIILVF